MALPVRISACVAALLAVASGAAVAAPLEGQKALDAILGHKLVAVDKADDGMTMQFGKDGSATSTAGGQERSGRWTFEGGQLCVNGKAPKDCATPVVDGDIVRFSSGSEVHTMKIEP